MSTGVQARGGTSPTGSIATRGVRASSNYDRRTGVSSTTGDPFFSSVQLLAGNNNAPNGTTTFTDQSSAARTLTRQGSTIYSNAQAPTGLTTSISVAASGDYLTAADAASLELGSSNFTMECWVYAPLGGTACLLSKTNAADTTRGFDILMFGSGNVQFYGSSDGTNNDIANGQLMGTYAASTWTHVEIGRSGNTFYPFINGVLGSTWTSSAAFTNNANNFSVFARDGNGLGMGANIGTCYVASLRVTIGAVRHTAGFTPSALPLPTS